MSLYAIDGEQDRPHEYEEVITDQHLSDGVLEGLPGEYEYVHNYGYY